MKPITLGDLKQAVTDYEEPGKGLSQEQAMKAALALYEQALGSAEDDAAHDEALKRRIADVRAQRPLPEGSGVPGTNVQDVLAWREGGIAAHRKALADDVKRWETARGVAFGAISAAAAVALGPGASAQGVATALLPLVGLLQDLSSTKPWEKS